MYWYLFFPMKEFMKGMQKKSGLGGNEILQVEEIIIAIFIIYSTVTTKSAGWSFFQLHRPSID